jgi:hypothetical protein
MPSIFLSHTSIDKPFVEKLAVELKRLGVNVWFDKWEIKVGDSITWKIEDGIKNNEFLGIVLSPEALASAWVKSEIGAAWSKQMKNKNFTVLPIFYRSCEIPMFLADRRYADFRDDYQRGFVELAGVLGIKETETMSIENWRRFALRKMSGWQSFRKQEFEFLVTRLVDRALEFNWSTWVGGTQTPYSITLTASQKSTISIRLSGKTFAYMASLENIWNPNRIKASDFTIYVGNSINECEEFVWRKMEDHKQKVGNPTGKADHQVHRFSRTGEIAELSRKLAREMSWYKGDKIL